MDFEFCPEVTMFTEARSTTCSGNKVSISVSTTSSGTESYHFTWFCEIVKKRTTFFVINKCSYGELDDFIRGIRPMHELNSTTFTILSGYFFDIAEVRKCIDIWISDDYKIPPTAAITSKRSTLGYARFSPPRDDSISSISSTEFHIDGIDKHN
jgi:hypothetical protein